MAIQHRIMLQNMSIMPALCLMAPDVVLCSRQHTLLPAPFLLKHHIFHHDFHRLVMFAQQPVFMKVVKLWGFCLNMSRAIASSFLVTPLLSTEGTENA